MELTKTNTEAKHDKDTHVYNSGHLVFIYDIFLNLYSVGLLIIPDTAFSLVPRVCPSYLQRAFFLTFRKHLFFLWKMGKGKSP